MKALAGAGAALAQASTAWRDLCASEANIARLNRYKRLTAGMKDDLRIASIRAAEARKTLDSLLKVSP